VGDWKGPQTRRKEKATCQKVKNDRENKRGYKREYYGWLNKNKWRGKGPDEKNFCPWEYQKGGANAGLSKQHINGRGAE